MGQHYKDVLSRSHCGDGFVNALSYERGKRACTVSTLRDRGSDQTLGSILKEFGTQLLCLVCGWSNSINPYQNHLK